MAERSNIAGISTSKFHKIKFAPSL